MISTRTATCVERGADHQYPGMGVHCALGRLSSHCVAFSTSIFWISGAVAMRAFDFTRYGKGFSAWLGPNNRSETKRTDTEFG